jgi:imidazole glycerol-phosphate synthase subunit HisF
MLLPRITPCLLVHQGGLVKTTGFQKPVYVGDPINAVKIFNDKQADELIVVDIDATINQAEPDYKLIEELASECRMPLCYGGGVTTAAQAKRIIGLGVEKVSVSAAAVANPQLITQMSEEVGRQSVVVVIDVKAQRSLLKTTSTVFTHNATRSARVEAIEFAKQAERAGAGEIVINSIDRDGRMKGYDLDLAAKVRAAVGLPITVLGGAGSLEDMAALVQTCGVVGAAAGSLFVFKGPHRAVLINYPTQAQKSIVFDAVGPTVRP